MGATGVFRELCWALFRSIFAWRFFILIDFNEHMPGKIIKEQPNRLIARIYDVERGCVKRDVGARDVQRASQFI